MINPKTKTFTRSFSEYCLKNLLETIGNDTPVQFTGEQFGFPVQQDWLAELTTSAQQTLLIATDKLTDNKLLEYCQACVTRKVRVYLLLGKPEDSEKAIRLLSGHCLIRTDVKQAGSLLMADNSQELVLSRALDGELQKTAGLRLVLAQRTDFYHYFCRLFWNQAQQEYLLPNQPRAVKASPFGEISIQNECHDPKLLLKTIQKQWTNSQLATLSELRQEKWLGYTLSQLSTTEGQPILNLNNADVASLQTLVKHCTQLACVEQPLPDMVLSTGDEILFLPQSTLQPNTAAWVVKLVEAQIWEVKAFLENLSEQAPLRYQETCLLQEMVQPFRFLDEPKKVYQRKDWLEHRLADIYLDAMTTFMNPDIDSLTYDSTQFNRKRIALEIAFSVTLHPPYLPMGAKLDDLHHQWEQTQQKWKREIETLRGLLKKVEEQEQSFQGKVKSLLKGLLTGNLQWKLTQDKQITELAQWLPLYADKVERQEKLDAINQVTDKLQRKLGNMQEEQDKAKQHIAWEEKRDDLKRQLGEAQNHGKKCTQELDKFREDFKLQEQQKSAELEAQWWDFVNNKVTANTWTKIIQSCCSSPQNWPVHFEDVLKSLEGYLENLKKRMLAFQAEEILSLIAFQPFSNSLNKEEQKETKRIKGILSNLRDSSQTEKEKLEQKLKQAEREAAYLQQETEKKRGDKKRHSEAQNHRDECTQELDRWKANYREQEQKIAKELEAQWQDFVNETMTANTWAKLVQNQCANLQNWQSVLKSLEVYVELLKKPMLALQADKILSLIEFKPFFNALKDEKKEAKRIKEILSIFRNSSQTKKEELDKKLKLAEREVTDSQQAIEKQGDRFIYVASNQHEKSSLTDILGGSQKKTKKLMIFTIEWPKEELPASGTELYRHQNQRWLCITEEAQFAQGQQDAKRLKAELCTKKPT